MFRGRKAEALRSSFSVWSPHWTSRLPSRIKNVSSSRVWTWSGTADWGGAVISMRDKAPPVWSPVTRKRYGAPRTLWTAPPVGGMMTGWGGFMDGLRARQRFGVRQSSGALDFAIVGAGLEALASTKAPED